MQRIFVLSGFRQKNVEVGEEAIVSSEWIGEAAAFLTCSDQKGLQRDPEQEQKKEGGKQLTCITWHGFEVGGSQV